ncbi:proto-oncogene tyrosine-protein kinase Src-like [Mercenaria mercenaria]|uniref:proto-oncogene tyrosine-protein kinase Src-like n=1 Tax=Mercenaria mercenaria TaxID=6596 RepID=UPI00234E4F46|nr:proto-oncogene tyrosine-protein kinase Src-like [Mercenaria mercenaria]
MGERMGLSGSELIEFVDRKEKEYTEREERMLRREDERHRRDEERRRHDDEQRWFEAQEAEKKRMFELEQAVKKRLFELERLEKERALKEEERSLREEERVLKQQELEMLKIKAEAGALGTDKSAEHLSSKTLRPRLPKFEETHGGSITSNRMNRSNVSCSMELQPSTEFQPVSQTIQREKPAFKKPICFICNKEGHIARECRNLSKRKTYLMVAIDGRSRTVPAAKIQVDTPYFTGEIEAMVVPNMICDLIIGNIKGVLERPDINWKTRDESQFSSGEDIAATGMMETQHAIKVGIMEPSEVCEVKEQTFDVEQMKIAQKDDETLKKLWIYAKDKAKLKTKRGFSLYHERSSIKYVNRGSRWHNKKGIYDRDINLRDDRGYKDHDPNISNHEKSWRQNDMRDDLGKEFIHAADGLCCKLEIPYPTVRRLVQFGELEVSRESVKLLKKLGSGCFGEVYAGKWHNTVDVAVKTLKQSQKTADDFLAEAKLMHHLRHNKLVQLMAVCTKSEPIWIITELMINGTLLDYLRKDIGKTLGFNSLADMAGQIADGMAYLETVNCVHRDLRAANILVGDHIEVKVAGFGLARLIHGSFEDADENTNFPIKWTAPEVAFDRKFSIKSDVWSYGVLLYELITHGCEPYPGMDKFVVLKRVEKGFRMNKPYSCPCPCPDPYYEIMRKCWNLTAINRPTFAFLQDFFNNYNEYAEETHHSIEQTPRRDDIRKLSATSGSSVKALGDNETETRLDLQQSVQMSTPHTYENVQNAVTAKQAQPESNTDNLAITPGFSVEALYSNKAETRLDLQQSVQMSTPHIYENVQNAVTAKQAQPESNTDNFAITPGFSVKALYSYKAEADDEISLYPDDILTDVDPVNKSWWIGIAANGTRGLFPAGHVEIFENVYEEIAKHQRI